MTEKVVVRSVSARFVEFLGYTALEAGLASGAPGHDCTIATQSQRPDKRAGWRH